MSYNLAEDILFGEPRRISHYQPIIKNPKLAINVTIACRNESGLVTGETYPATIEQGCRTCEFGALATSAEPCVICYKQHTPEKPYTMWTFDTQYDPFDEIFN